MHDLEHIYSYKRLIETILKKIPILTQNCITQIKKVNEYGIQHIFDARDTQRVADLGRSTAGLSSVFGLYIFLQSKSI